MASDESVTIPQSFSMQDSEYEFDDECDYRLGHPHSLSGISMCNSNSTAVYGHDDDGDSIGRGNYFQPDYGYCDTISMQQMSQLSMESFRYGDADGHEDYSDDERESKGQVESSDSDLESLGDSHSSPATPPGPQWRNQSADMDQVLPLQQEKHKEYYASKNKAKMMMMNTTKGDRCKLERATSFGDPTKKKIVVDKEAMTTDGSSEGGSGDLVGRSVVIKTRPRGGRRSLCMDLEEVKACWDLGFDLEHDHCTTLHSSSSSSATAVIMPTITTTSLSISENSTIDTSSGTNSPITKWRISSPGDDPRDVKARLRVWAQAVALASTSQHCC